MEPGDERKPFWVALLFDWHLFVSFVLLTVGIVLLFFESYWIVGIGAALIVLAALIPVIRLVVKR